MKPEQPLSISITTTDEAKKKCVFCGIDYTSRQTGRDARAQPTAMKEVAD